MASERFAHVVALGTDPIRADAPAGDYVRYDEAFERLQAQMDRLNSITGETVNWSEVVTLSTDILKNKSKDLLVMSFLTIGMLESVGYAGLTAALEAYRGLLSTFWDGAFPKPKPPQGRYNAVAYLVDKLLPLVELKGGKAKKHPDAGEKEAVHECADAAARLDEAVSAAFASQPETPNLLPLVRALNALRQAVGPLVDEAAAAPAAEPGAAGPAAAIPSTFGSIDAAIDSVITIGKYIQTQDNKDPRGYRLLRLAYFGGWHEPPRDRFVPAPQATRKQFFESTASAGDWKTLLDEAEGQFAETPLWLDTQRYVSLALNGLGAEYQPAAEAVALEVVALHGRLPQVFDLHFKDGTPFADGPTRAWVGEVCGRFGGSGGGGGGASANGDALGAAIAEARKLMSAAKGAEAVERLSAQMDASASRRERFRAQLALAGFCFDMNKLPLATSLLEGLERQIEQYHLEDWEPDLAARATERLYECLVKAQPRPDDEDARRQGQVFARLCRLDPATALKLQGKE